MESQTLIDRPFFSIFLFTLLFCSLSILNYAAKQYRASQSSLPSNSIVLVPAYHLACLLEDAPESSLRGQAYELAYPLMTPLACIFAPGWHYYYRQQLGKPSVNYWQWQDKPESKQLCPELTHLLNLPKPRGYSREILESLGTRQNPFWNSLLNNSVNTKGNINITFRDFRTNGKFADRDFRIQAQMRHFFKQWHDAACEQIGQERLIAVYRVCYGVSWETIEQIIQPPKESIATLIFQSSVPWWKMLGVTPLTPATKVEDAYKTLIRNWHPDLNAHPNATEISSRINLAYEQYQTFLEATRLFPNAKVWTKIREWLSTHP